LFDPPRSYRVINQNLVTSLARGLGLPLGTVTTSAVEIGVNHGVMAKASRSTTPKPMEASDPRLLPPIIEALRESGQLRVYRPERAEEFWNSDHDGWYVVERLVATPVTLSLADRLPGGVTGPDALNVWVSDPLPLRSPRINEWDFAGSFLFLVEELGQFQWPMGWFMSGISALRVVVDVLQDGLVLTSDGLFDVAGSEDKYGRWESEHPIEKLVSVGGVAGRPRRIDTIYKIAYMTDEQAYVVDGVHTRVNDILAYPLFIAD
jgi:hypothetical protein